MTKTIVFVHGAWMTPLCWERFVPYFENEGYRCLAPAWPYRDKPIAQLRSDPPPELAHLGVLDIVEHYKQAIAALPEPPILIGHSFGGLFVQLLLDQGVGVAGVAIDSAPPKGVLTLEWSALKSNAPVLFKWMGWERIAHLTFSEFQYAFVHTLPEAEQIAAYERQVVPETGRIFFEAGLALLDSHSAVTVHFDNNDRGPLLLIAGSDDHIVPAKLNRANYEAYSVSRARTDFKEFEGRTHWIIAQHGWQEVADFALRWLHIATGEAPVVMPAAS